MRTGMMADVYKPHVSGVTHTISFTARLTRLCLGSRLGNRMGAAARRASRMYAIERTTQILLQHYERLVYASRPRPDNWHVRLRGFLESHLQ